MARVDYWNIEQQIKSILETDAVLDPLDVPVFVEEELTMVSGPAIFVWLQRREAPESLQPIAAGRYTRFIIHIDIWVFEVALEVSEAIRKRDDLLGKVELALMAKRSLNSTVAASWIKGGEFENGSNSGGGFYSGASIELAAEVTAVSD